MSQTDATPSWSGYIFQGEVALCKAIEVINSLDNINQKYCLKLEQDEDFSIKTDNLEVFQVKAYLKKGCDKMNSYKNVIEELISKYYYSLSKPKNPYDKRSNIPSSRIEKRKRPIKAYLITHSNISDYDNTLQEYNKRFSSIDFNYFDTIHGQYRLDNIEEKLGNAITQYFAKNNLQLTNLNNVRNYCSQKISSYIKKRHQTKELYSITFTKIIEWLTKPDIEYNDFAWHQIESILTKTLSEDLQALALEEEEKNLEYEKLDKCLLHLEKLDRENLQNLITRLTPHKKFNFGYDVIDSSSVRKIVSKSIRKILLDPNEYENLTYLKDKELYQISTIGDNPEIKTQKQLLLEKINSNTCSDIDFYITEHMNVSKEEVSSRTQNILGYEPSEINEEEIDTKLDDTNSFGLIDVEQTIEILNK